MPKAKYEHACLLIQAQVLFSFKWNIVESLLESQGGLKLMTKTKTANWHVLSTLLSCQDPWVLAEQMAANESDFSAFLPGGCDQWVCEQKWGMPFLGPAPKTGRSICLLGPSSFPLLEEDENGSWRLEPQMLASCWGWQSCLSSPQPPPFSLYQGREIKISLL